MNIRALDDIAVEYRAALAESQRAMKARQDGEKALRQAVEESMSRVEALRQELHAAALGMTSYEFGQQWILGQEVGHL